jgi:hypothetical protein
MNGDRSLDTHCKRKERHCATLTAAGCEGLTSAFLNVSLSNCTNEFVCVTSKTSSRCFLLSPEGGGIKGLEEENGQASGFGSFVSLAESRRWHEELLADRDFGCAGYAWDVHYKACSLFGMMNRVLTT